MAIMISITTSSCALNQAGYKTTKPIIVRPPATKAISRKNKLFKPVPSQLPSQPTKFKEIIKFHPKDKIKNKNTVTLEKRVARNERQIAQLNKAIALHGQLLLKSEGKFKVARIGYFKLGSDKICCGLEKKIQEAILWGEKEGYVPIKIIGYADDDGWQGNQKLSRRRAENVYKRILFHRPKFKDLNIEIIGAGPSVMFGTGSMNRRVMIIFQKKQ